MGWASFVLIVLVSGNTERIGVFGSLDACLSALRASVAVSTNGTVMQLADAPADAGFHISGYCIPIETD